MKAINYIFVHESDSKILSRAHLNNNLSEFRHYIVVDAGSGCRISGSQLRRQHPDAQILGVSEVIGRQIKPSEVMNSIRREMSDLR